MTKLMRLRAPKAAAALFGILWFLGMTAFDHDRMDALLLGIRAVSAALAAMAWYWLMNRAVRQRQSLDPNSSL